MDKKKDENLNLLRAQYNAGDINLEAYSKYITQWFDIIRKKKNGSELEVQDFSDPEPNT
jgi:hypothetical protein